MNYSGLSAITNYIRTNLIADYDGMVVIPDNVIIDTESEDEFVRITIIPATSNQLEIGPTSAFRFSGIVAIQVFTKENIGRKRAFDIVDSITSYTRFKLLGSVRLGSEDVVAVSNNESGWYQVNINIPYRFEEIYNQQ